MNIKLCSALLCSALLCSALLLCTQVKGGCDPKNTKAQNLFIQYKKDQIEGNPKLAGVIGKLTFESACLGSGAFGVVFKIPTQPDPNNANPMAVKIFYKKKNLFKEEQKKELNNELKILEASGNLLTTPEDVLKNDTIVIPMKYVSGIDVLEFLEKKPEPTPYEKYPLIVCIIEKLYELHHDKKIMHRDIKVENIKYDPDKKTCNYVDFGLSDTKEDVESKSYTALDSVFSKGTRVYQSLHLYFHNKNCIEQKNAIPAVPILLYNDFYAMNITLLEIIIGFFLSDAIEKNKLDQFASILTKKSPLNALITKKLTILKSNQKTKEIGNIGQFIWDEIQKWGKEDYSGPSANPDKDPRTFSIQDELEYLKKLKEIAPPLPPLDPKKTTS